jgi:hypothetical protein
MLHAASRDNMRNAQNPLDMGTIANFCSEIKSSKNAHSFLNRECIVNQCFAAISETYAEIVPKSFQKKVQYR